MKTIEIGSQMQQLQIQKAKLRLEEKKKLIEEKEKKLKERARKQKVQELIRFGELIEKVGLNIDTTTLFGALLDIKEQAKDSHNLKRWNSKATLTLEKEASQHRERFAIRFQEAPNKEIKEALKRLKFKWNSFRGEWYGKAHKTDLEKAIGAVQAKVEKLS